MNAAPNNVLLVMINHHVGNFVVSLPFLHALAAHFGDRVDVLVDSRFACLARLLPGIRSVIPYEQHDRRSSRLRHACRFLALARRLAFGRYDLAVDVGGGIQSVTLTLLTLARRRVGLRDSRRSWAYSERLPSFDGPHASDRFMPFMKWMGVETKPSVLLEAGPGARTEVLNRLPILKDRRAVVVHAGAGYAFRQWPRERFLAVAGEVIRRWNRPIVFIGAPGEEAALKSLVAELRQSGAAFSLIADLDIVVALYERSDLLISNESGPTHLAAATRLPIVTIFGPSKETKWRPVRETDVTILRGRVCPPECRWGRCAHDLACIMDLQVGDVLAAAAPYLDRDRARAD